jgi:hypothetical protein
MLDSPILNSLANIAPFPGGPRRARVLPFRDQTPGIEGMGESVALQGASKGITEGRF